MLEDTIVPAGTFLTEPPCDWKNLSVVFVLTNTNVKEGFEVP